jgi:hypothetical protein
LRMIFDTGLRLHEGAPPGAVSDASAAPAPGPDRPPGLQQTDFLHAFGLLMEGFIMHTFSTVDTGTSS